MASHQTLQEKHPASGKTVSLQKSFYPVDRYTCCGFLFAQDTEQTEPNQTSASTKYTDPAFCVRTHSWLQLTS